MGKFLPNENVDILFKKYTEQLIILNPSQGILFLVDTWMGR